MAILDTAMVAVHLAFAGVWAGSVVFVALAVLPAARDADLAEDALASVTGRLVTISRVSALALFVSGGHMAGTFYTVGSLTGTTRGHLVLGMVALWFVLAALVEVAGRKLTDGGAARDARPYLLAAAVVALLLLVDGGFLAGGVV